MKNKIAYLGLLIMMSSYQVNADALIFRGSQAQKEYEQRTDNQKDLYSAQISNSADPSVLGNYDLQDINGVQSKMAINSDGTFSWYMMYKKINLETHGYWERQDDTITLTTDPMPGDIAFKYKDSNNTGTNMPKYMAMGDFIINVSYEPKANLDKNGPLKGVKVTCSGVYGVTSAITDDNGQAICHRAGTPLNFITLEAPGLPNKTTFNKPRFDDLSWNFTFDYERAHTGYAFYKERMTYQNGVLSWNAASLGGTQTWKYFK